MAESTVEILGGAVTTGALRPRPAINLDNEFFFSELHAGRLAIQCCSDCNELRQPPIPMCPHCNSLNWSPKQMSGAAELVSYVRMYHPVRPPFVDGYIVVLVQLEEGPRLVMNVEGLTEDEMEIGMALEVWPVAVDPELTVPMAFPANGSNNAEEAGE